jgi:hypothetical protein
MLSVDHGFNTSVKRSGHAACWCAALGGMVQFGGWPPSAQLSDVVRHEGSSCPLFYMPVTTVARHLHRADQRRGVDSLEVALSHQRQHRLRELLNLASSDGALNAHINGAEGNGLREDWRPRWGNDVHATAIAQLLHSPTPSTLPVTTDEASERGFVYDEGYVSDIAESATLDSSSEDGDDASTASSRSAAQEGAPVPGPSSPAPSLQLPPPPHSAVELYATPNSPAGMIAPIITVELLRQVAEETEDRMTYSSVAAAAAADAGVASATGSHGGRTTVSRSTHTGTAAAPSTLHSFGKNNHQPAVDREAPPVQSDTQNVLGKYTVRPLRWQRIRPPVAPRTRHGHHLVSCGDRLYVIGGSYWAHGNALASTDMMYDIRRKVWQQVSSLFPPRFCAALAKSNSVRTGKSLPASWASMAATTAAAGTSSELQMQDEQVLYYFGGLNYSRQLTNTLYRLWLPQETLEELPQYGAVPREQFKGILVCDMQRECNPAERECGERSVGQLFYLDGLQDGRPMAPYLRVYNVATGVWVRVCPSPDLVRSQVSLLQYELVAAESEERGAGDTPTRLRRFEVVGGMPSRRGKQRRSRMCYSFDAVQQRFDYSNALPVPGLTAHCTVPLPAETEEPLASLIPSINTDAVVTTDTTHSPPSLLLADGVTSVAAYRSAVRLLREEYGVWSLCCGGNEDWNDAEQNSLGVPVGWLYLLAPRAIPLSEVARVQMECLRIPMAIRGVAKDELLDELF